MKRDVMNIKRKIYFTLIFLFLLFSTNYSVGCAFTKLVNKDAGGTTIKGDVGGISLGMIAVLVLVVAIILYLIGALIKNPRFTFIAKDELYQLLLSIVFSVSIVGIIIGACMFNSEVLTYASTHSNIKISDLTFTSDPASDAISILNENSDDLSSRIRGYLDLSIKYNINSAVMYMAYNPLSGAQIIPVGAHQSAYYSMYSLLVFTFAMPALVSLNVQKLVLLFIRDIGPYLIGIGILFRLFRPFRKIGNMFLASAMVLLVVYPILYLFMILSASAAISQPPPSLSKIQIANPSVSVGVLWNLSMLMVMGYFVPTFVIAISVSFISSLSKGLSMVAT